MAAAMCFRSRGVFQLSKRTLAALNNNLLGKQYGRNPNGSCRTYYTSFISNPTHRLSTDSAKICFISCQRNFHQHLNHKTQVKVIPLWQVRRFYSSEKANITEEILKSKIAEDSKSGESDESAKSESQNKDEKKKDSMFSGKNAWKLGLVSLVTMGFMLSGNLLLLWGGPIIDPEGNEVPDEFTHLPKWKAYPKRTIKEMHLFKKMIMEPSSEKLLPDPVKEPYYQPPYTLVLEMTGVLVHPDWTLGTGWRFKKRPAVEYFLQQVGPPMFEVVIYTREQGFTAFPIIDALDPNGFISYRLFRDATRYTDGTHVKDLNCLNRDLSKVIIVDCDPKAFKNNPSNGVFLKRWSGSDDDRSLVDLAAFLRTLAQNEVEDVRPVLEYYSQFDDPLEAFKENHRKLQEEREKLRTASHTPEKKGFAGNFTMGLRGRNR